MEETEATNIIENELAHYRSKSYPELKEMIDENSVVKKVKSESGQKYQLEITALWDDEPNGNIRVVGSVDNMGWHSFMPFNSDFIMSPKGDLIDE